jgi:hypothetical protein
VAAAGPMCRKALDLMDQLHYSPDRQVRFWFLMKGNDATSQYIWSGQNGGANRIFPSRGVGNDLGINLRDATNTDSVFIDSSTSYTVASMAGTWAHVIASWDGSIARAQLYVDGTSVGGGSPTITNVASDYSCTDWAIGSQVGGTISQMDICDFFFDQTTSLDLSIASNVQKFRDVSGNAVDLGTAGSNPLGSQPILCFTGGVSGWAANKGSGGNFTSSGTFANSPTSPP